MSSIALPGFGYISSELIMTLHCSLYDIQPYTVVIMVKIATKLLKFAPKDGLAR